MNAVKPTFKDLITKSEEPVLVDFWAEWCGPCRMMAPILEEFAKKNKGKVKVLKINVDKNQNVSMQFQVQSIPTLMLFHKGKVLWRSAGAMSLPQLESAIMPHL